MTEHRIFYLVLLISASAVASAQLGVYFLERSNVGLASNSSALCDQFSSPSGTNTIAVNMLVNYGNDTMKWYNQTMVPSSWNAYELTLYLTRCNVQTVYYGAPLDEHLVTSINGVSGHGAWSWSIWTFCRSQNAWSYSQVGIDQIRLANGQTLAWVYETTSSIYAAPPEPGSHTVGSCS